ncbi:hypothetical protein M8C21_003652 [Ambrosia artemisiifolia]|uniref:CTP synthase N-terminal domain-containing protein n=1 Tax=Ambrosia artemisiifolia TaxID=4212 RepID=A0AAD5D1U2_AMBAR|nr:hypothetical protein M8C21_003652 [Ambrosia artemisiifolia]
MQSPGGCGVVKEEMKYVLVTGGVVSGLGKGVTASSIGVLLQACGLRVTSIKIGLCLYELCPASFDILLVLCKLEVKMISLW